MKDVYDKAIEYFTKYPKRIDKAWSEPNKVKYGYLFRFLTTDGSFDSKRNVGCPIMVHNRRYVAQTQKLTEICHKAKLPVSITIENIVSYLPEFARIQRLADKQLKREIPSCVV